MKRTVVFFSFLLLLALTACGGAELETTTAVSPLANTDDPLSNPAESTSATAVAAQEFTPTENFTEATKLRELDHTHGAEEPVVTIIEYGDFQ
jgi:hypothetical protein